ncbi:MAG: hypothetical protein C0490_18850 [Marivirga sp.]|nr:hypothetical protein [Marivirga sp.]
MSTKKTFWQIGQTNNAGSGEYKILLFAFIVLLLPFLFTQTPITIFDFSKSGQVGDTIGGITAPFVGLLSAYLIYKAFLVQVDANKIQSKNNEFAIALKLIDDLELKLNQQNNPYEYSLADGKSSKVEGSNFYEIVRFWNGMHTYRKHYTRMIVLMIRQINYFKKFVDRSKTLTLNDRLLLLEKASLTFGSNLHNAFETLLMTETGELSQEEKQFYTYCRKFNDTTLQDFLFYMVDINDFDESELDAKN